MEKVRTLLIALAVLACLAAAPANATVLVPVDLAELSRDAGAIVRGRVTAAAAQWTADRRAIETVVTIDAESSLKGSLGRRVQFIVPGGTLGRYRNLVAGAPEFIVGQRVIVFLGWTGPSYPYLLGLGQGVYRIAPNRERTGWLVTPPAIIETAGPMRIVRGDPARRSLTLGDFEARVRELAGARR